MTLKIGNNMKRNTIVIDPNTTIRQALESQDINYSAGVTTLDGCPLQVGDMDKTFASFGIVEKATLLNVVKADNAAR